MLLYVQYFSLLDSISAWIFGLTYMMLCKSILQKSVYYMSMNCSYLLL